MIVLSWSERIVSRCDSDASSNSARTVPARAAYVMAPEDRPSNTAMNQPLIQDIVQSPRKRRRVLQTQTAETCETTVAEIHDMESAIRDNLLVTACLLHVPSEPRWADITDKQSRQKERVPVVTALLTDHTGPITLELWRKQNDDVLRKWNNRESREQGTLFITVKLFFVRGASRAKAEHILPTKNTATGDRTEIDLVDAEEHEILLMFAPSLSSHLSTAFVFPELKRSPPYAVSVKGIVASLQRVTSSRDANPMRHFKFHDYTGKCVACMAFGRQTDCNAVADGNEVVLFVAQALLGNQNNDGSLWLYDTAHIVLLRQDCLIPPFHETIQLRA